MNSAPGEVGVASGRRMVRFSVMARHITERVDDPSAAGVERYVGLEHLDSESLRISRWGAPSDVEATKLRFQPGDLIFGKRRAYQRKLARADFEGICSAHAMVLRPIAEAIVPAFLAYFMQSEQFVERAMAISVGSLSPTINWRVLAEEQFVIPTIQDQRRIVEVMEAVDAAVATYNLVAVQSELVLRALIDSAFSVAGRNGDDWRETNLAQVTSKISDGVHKRPEYATDGVPFIRVENLTRGRGIDFADTRFVTQEDHEEFCRRTLPERGDVLVSKDGTLGVARLVETDEPFSIFVSVALLKPKPDVLDGRFLRAYFESTPFQRHVRRRIAGSALKHIHLVDFRSAPIAVPPIATQRRVAANFAVAEAAVDAAHQQLLRLRALKQEVLSRLLDQPDVH